MIGRKEKSTNEEKVVAMIPRLRKIAVFRQEVRPNRDLRIYHPMTFKTKALAAFTAIAVGGIALTGTAQAALNAQQTKIASFLPPNVVLENPVSGQTLATPIQLADAVNATIGSKKISKKLSAKAAVQAAFELSLAQSGTYSTVVLGQVSTTVAKSSTKLNQAISGAFLGFDFGQTTDDNSVAAALIDSSLLGINASSLTGSKQSLAYIAATKAAVKSAGANAVGASVGAAAQFASSSLLTSIIKAAVSKASSSYEAIAQAVATATKAIQQGNYTDTTGASIVSAVQAGYNAAFAASHGGALPSKGKRSEVATNAAAAVNLGESQTSGVGAAGLANYTYANLSAGPVTDIYGL